MGNVDVGAALEKITLFLQKWYPSEIAPLVVKKQIQATGAVMEEMTEKDLKLLLSRIQMVILPSFMPPDKARKEVMRLRKEIGIGF